MRPATSRADQTRGTVEALIEQVRARVFTVPTDRPESDGTLKWQSTTMVLAEVAAGGAEGIGYTYANAGAASVIHETLADAITGYSALDLPRCYQSLRAAIRNNGNSGLAAMAVAAVDIALWDLKAKLLNLPVASLLGMVRPEIPAYGSGGFTSYTIDELREQLSGWVASGISMVKMKIGRDPFADPKRVEAARAAIGPRAELFVDANGAYHVKQALQLGQVFKQSGVTWFEEPVVHSDFAGTRFVREHLAAGMDISSGEYGFDLDYFRRLIDSQAVDVLQADATRRSFSGFLDVASLCLAANLPLSSHCAPSLHVPLCCHCQQARHVEYFHDHVRIEQVLFDGAAQAVDGWLQPDLSRPGLGLILKESDARRFERN